MLASCVRRCCGVRNDNKLGNETFAYPFELVAPEPNYPESAHHSSGTVYVFEGESGTTLECSPAAWLIVSVKLTQLLHRVLRIEMIQQARAVTWSERSVAMTR